MANSKKIISADGTTFWVKESFRCENPQEHHNYSLINDYKLTSYLHNERGPAIISISQINESYWINGKNVNKKEWARLSFHTKLEDIIGD